MPSTAERSSFTSLHLIIKEKTNKNLGEFQGAKGE